MVNLFEDLTVHHPGIFSNLQFIGFFREIFVFQAVIEIQTRIRVLADQVTLTIKTRNRNRQTVFHIHNQYQPAGRRDLIVRHDRLNNDARTLVDFLSADVFRTETLILNIAFIKPRNPVKQVSYPKLIASTQTRLKNILTLGIALDRFYKPKQTPGMNNHLIVVLPLNKEHTVGFAGVFLPLHKNRKRLVTEFKSNNLRLS